LNVVLHDQPQIKS